ncbi:hypothetical protein ACFL20_10470 [Spirochaetota bacterium]
MKDGKFTVEDIRRITADFESKRDKIKNQARTRKKHERIRCPKCSSISKPIRESWGGHQIRRCRKGHEFTYNYTVEALLQWKFNYKVKI